MVSEYRAVTFPMTIIFLAILFGVLAVIGFFMITDSISTSGFIFGIFLCPICAALTVVSVILAVKNQTKHTDYPESQYHIDYMIADMEHMPEKKEYKHLKERKLVHYQCNEYEYWYLYCPKTHIEVKEPEPTYKHTLKNNPEDYRINTTP